jgi:hypothetical protein
LLAVALAVLLSFVLAPLVRTAKLMDPARLFGDRRRLAHLAIGGTIAMKATQLAGDLPSL